MTAAAVGPVLAILWLVWVVLVLVWLRKTYQGLKVLVRSLQSEVDQVKALIQARDSELSRFSPPAGGASVTFTPAGQTTYTCIYENCDGAHITTDDLDVAERWLDGHAETVPHDGRWFITFRVEYPGSSLTAVMYRQPILLVGA